MACRKVSHLSCAVTARTRPAPVWRWRCCHCMTVIEETLGGALPRSNAELCATRGQWLRVFNLIYEGEVVVGGVHRTTTRAGAPMRRRRSEWISGVELHRDTGRLVYVNRVIGRKHGRYIEHIVEIDTGTVIRDVNTPLAEHVDRGAAKPEQRRKH
jgi:hypothetical protein